MDQLIPAAAYARVSTDHQVEDGLSIPAQLEECRKWGQAHGYEVVMEFVDAGKSGSDTEREELLKMRALAESRTPPFKAIIVWKTDRLARNAELSLVFRALLERRGIELLSVTEPNIDGPIGQLISVVMAGINEFYPRQLADSTLRGGKKGTMDGYAQGGTPPFGMLKVDAGNGKKKYAPDPSKAGLIRRIYEMRASGEPLQNIQRWLIAEGIPADRGGRWETNTIWNILHKHQLVYLGHLVYNRTRQVKRGCTHIRKPKEDWVICRDAHEAVITQELADAVNAVQAATRERTCNPYAASRFRVLAPKGPLVGIIECGLCGDRFVRVLGGATGRRKHYYHCYRNTPSILHGREGCKNTWLSAAEIETVVRMAVEARIRDPHFLANLRASAASGKARQKDEISARLQGLQKERAALKRKQAILQEAILDETIPRDMARPKMHELVQAVARIDDEIERVERTELPPVIPEELANLSEEDVRGFFEDELPEEDYRHMLHLLVSRIVVDPDVVTMEYRIGFPPQRWIRKRMRRGCGLLGLVPATD